MSRNVAFSKTSKLSTKQEKCIAALIQHPTQAKAAEACGITVRTIQRWLLEPSFAAAFRDAKTQLFAATTNRLRQAGPVAVRTLYQIATNEDTPPGAPSRVAAARALLEFGITHVEIEDVLARLERLEKDRGDDDGEI
jgi:hypothetical protein